MTQLWHIDLVTGKRGIHLDDQRMRGQHKEIFQLWDCIQNGKRHATVQYAIDYNCPVSRAIIYHAVLLYYCKERGLFKISPKQLHDSIFYKETELYLDYSPYAKFHTDELYLEHCRNIHEKQLARGGYILNGVKHSGSQFESMFNPKGG